MGLIYTVTDAYRDRVLQLFQENLQAGQYADTNAAVLEFVSNWLKGRGWRRRVKQLYNQGGLGGPPKDWAVNALIIEGQRGFDLKRES